MNKKTFLFFSSMIVLVSILVSISFFDYSDNVLAGQIPLRCTTDADCATDTSLSVCSVAKCRVSTGTCYQTPVTNGTPCEDGNSCTFGEKCFSGICKGHKKAAGTYCDDGSACTEFEKCNAHGQCIGDKKVTDDENACTKDWCDPKVGVINQPIQNCKV